nr:hypothetical protein [Tanacetum cinerariifolium]
MEYGPGEPDGCVKVRHKVRHIFDTALKSAPTVYVSVNSPPRHDILPENNVLERGYTTGIQNFKFVQTTKKRLNSAHMKATYTTRRGCRHNTEDMCNPFGSERSFRKWPIMAAYNKDTVKMTAVSHTLGSDGDITAAYDKGDYLTKAALKHYIYSSRKAECGLILLLIQRQNIRLKAFNTNAQPKPYDPIIVATHTSLSSHTMYSGNESTGGIKEA